MLHTYPSDHLSLDLLIVQMGKKYNSICCRNVVQREMDEQSYGEQLVNKISSCLCLCQFYHQNSKYLDTILLHHTLNGMFFYLQKWPLHSALWEYAHRLFMNCSHEYSHIPYITVITTSYLNAVYLILWINFKEIKFERNGNLQNASLQSICSGITQFKYRISMWCSNQKYLNEIIWIVLWWNDLKSISQMKSRSKLCGIAMQIIFSVAPAFIQYKERIPHKTNVL